MFRKFNKKDYTQLKVYKFIILFNTLNKAFKLIIIIKLNYLIKFNALFFKKKQIKKRRVRLIELKFKLLIEQIYIV